MRTCTCNFVPKPFSFIQWPREANHLAWPPNEAGKPGNKAVLYAYTMKPRSLGMGLCSTHIHIPNEAEKSGNGAVLYAHTLPQGTDHHRLVLGPPRTPVCLPLASLLWLGCGLSHYGDEGLVPLQARGEGSVHSLGAGWLAGVGGARRGWGTSGERPLWRTEMTRGASWGKGKMTKSQFGIIRVTVYVEIFAGILFCETEKKLAPQNFCSLISQYVACLVLRPNAEKFSTFFYFRKCRPTHEMHEN